MRKAFELKHIVPRSFMIGGLTAKWGIGENRDDRYKNPLYAWTISGRANGSTDFSPLLDKMGTGNALTLSGFNGTPGSGFENGYLVFDGVNDGAISSAFDLGKHWTVVGDYLFTPESTGRAGIQKVHSFRMTNADPKGMDIYINSTSGIWAPGHRSTKAVCSDGRIYTANWGKLMNTYAQPIENSASPIYVGIAAPAGPALFVSLKFKNLAIYEGAPLSEEQCKKAYDWLQTL